MKNPVIDFLNDLLERGLEKMGLYYSQYRGFVFDNRDPQDLNRLQLCVPEITGDSILTTWAWPSSNYSGKGYGIQLLPQINDLVWVRFEKGNPRKPLWSYGHFGTEEKPRDLPSAPHVWFRTPKGLTVVFNEVDLTISLYEKGKTIYSACLAEKNIDKLEKLIDILINARINTALGPQGLLPNFIVDLETLKQELPEIKSNNIKLS